MRWLAFVLMMFASSLTLAHDEAVSHCNCNEWGLQKYPGVLESTPYVGFEMSFLWDSPSEIRERVWSWRGVKEYEKLYDELSFQYDNAYENCSAAHRRAIRNFRVHSCLSVIETEKTANYIRYEWRMVLPNLKATYRTYISHRWGKSNEWHQAQHASLYTDEEIEKGRRDAEESYASGLTAIARLEENFSQLWEEIYDHCRTIHRCRDTSFEQGLFYYHRGEYLDSARHMDEYISISKEVGEGDSLKASDYLQLSTSYQFALQYRQAIQALDEAIERYPEKKELYIQRIAAYFEEGRYDEAIRDFILQELDKELQTASDPSKIALAKAFLAGASHGVVEGARECPQSFLYSIRGTGQLIWAGVNDPIGVPSAILSEVGNLVTLMRSSEYNEVLQAVAPELGELCKEWESLKEEVRWERTGYVFGKYGFDWLASCGQKKLLDICVKLRSTNTLCNVKTCLTSPGDKASVCLTAEQIATHRTEYFKKATIQWDKQGKHIEGHNSRKNLPPEKLETYSLLTHKNPEDLLKNHAGKGSPKPIRESHPWETGYKEDVNFGEVIGMWKSKGGGYSKETTWGRIHYDKDGTAHIVPIKPVDSP